MPEPNSAEHRPANFLLAVGLVLLPWGVLAAIFYF